jgi:hypothetical protein
MGKRMRAKLQAIKQLRMRMHAPVADTGKWLRAVFQGYFNYHAIPGKRPSGYSLSGMGSSGFGGGFCVAAASDGPGPLGAADSVCQPMASIAADSTPVPECTL